MYTMRIAFITGRTPLLAHKEIEAAATILPFQWSATILPTGVYLLKPDESALGENDFLAPENSELQSSIVKLQQRLGGTVKIAYCGQLVKVDGILQACEKIVTEISCREFGISLYGKGVSVFKLGLSLKKRLKAQDLRTRVIPPKEGEALSSAQTFFHNLAQLQEPKGVELVIIQEGTSYWVGYTLTVQDIDSYTRRDFSIPAPDPVSGMLTPKLAQSMLNLAVGARTDQLVYDPFCGNGRIVLEAELMGLSACGSDREAEKISASQQNYAWLAKEYGLPPQSALFWVGDATVAQSSEPLLAILKNRSFALVSEPYLGKPFRAPLSTTEAQVWQKELEELYTRFFKLWTQQKIKPAKMIIIFPRAMLQNRKELSLYQEMVDRLKQIGYSSSQVSDYRRPDAVIAREIVEISYK